MDNNPTEVSGLQAHSAPSMFRKTWLSIRGRILGGLMLVLPVLITLWVIYWLYSTLEKFVIDPLALLVLWQVRGRQPDMELPFWFEAYAAPLIAILVALLLLYGLGFFVRSRLRRAIDWVLLRVPVISVVYDGVRKVFRALEKQPGRQRPQRVVLVSFPHPGTRVPAFVTSTCRDVETQKIILCVYVPTTPVPTSGYFLLVPEEDVIELNWSSDQALQAIISAGLTAPPEVRYFKTDLAPPSNPVVARITKDLPTSETDNCR
ncbi:MAG TPA: DUF502 domain-containing protein [Gemmataceae bacterium]|nr:DUF502 domain-containing protein [Gemmataceae bacterium]